MLPRLLLVLALLVSPAWADETPSDLLGYHDDFDGPKALDGLIEPGFKDPWTITLGDGVLSIRNDSSNSTLHYFPLSAVKFAGQSGRTATDGTEPAARVRASDTHDGGVGVLVGYPNGGSDYVVFAVSNGQRYVVLTKTAGRLKVTEFEKNEAISAEGFNELLLERQSGVMRFLVNGTEVYEQPEADLKDAPVGVAVFGRGRFEFDAVSVRAPAAWVAELSRGAEQCQLEPATYDDKVVLVGAYSGAADSTVSIAGQDDVTEVVDLEIASGQSPLYLVVTAYDPVIWRLSGAVERVRRFAAVGEAGVVGLPRDRLEFLAEGACFRHFNEEGKDMARAQAITSVALGNTVDLTGAVYEPASLAITDAAVLAHSQPAPVGIAEAWDPELKRQMLRFTPAGLVDLDPKTVISNRTVEPYQVLPAEYGLAQLIADSILERQGPTTFWVGKPMPRYPAGLAGAHLVTFIFAPGLPEPEGSPGHSKVIHRISPTHRPEP